MGIDVTIGMLASKTEVRHQEHPEAPAIEGHWMNPRINTWGMTIGGWHKVMQRIGLFTLVECSCYGEWERGVYQLTDNDLDEIITCAAYVQRKHPGVKPKCRASDEELDVAIAAWFSWWARWAQKQSMPAYIQVSY